MDRRSVLSLLSVAVVFGLAAPAAQAADALETIMSRKTIRIAIPTDYPPYGFVGPDLKPQGLDISMAELIGQKMGVKVELVPVTSANRIPYLQTNKADLVISTLGKNAEREKVLDFSYAYAPFFQAVFGGKAVAVKSAADMAGKSVAVTRGAMEDQELEKITPPGVIVKRYEDNAATAAAYVAGQTDLVAISSAAGGTIMMKQPQTNTEFKFLIKDSPCFIGIAKGEDKLREKVNEIIVAAKKDGTLDAMSKKWLGREAGDLPQ
ncbi:amino acid ABC transporter substrate-binding protein [Azorhizobium oxalatiphilum]|uniref:Amino acid ABC transporter substrate-binding protein n=1 Tax=Azorhizobium oxalatiphilum TaxID=980631 RepID=A0A917FI87_9HYPH|nr:transporter substrate-binding domain-containing protein [Azorhizobium oxalatiphilum]GGF81675.1 amino acid ABC transporter substrate-binding protein [Azorhizobium oxalatiphilum]